VVHNTPPSDEWYTTHHLVMSGTQHTT